jgi:hypothetical protein
MIGDHYLGEELVQQIMLPRLQRQTERGEEGGEHYFLARILGEVTGKTSEVEYLKIKLKQLK